MVRSWLSRVAATGIFQRPSVGGGAFSAAIMGIVIEDALAAMPLYLAWELLGPGVVGGLARSLCAFFPGTKGLAVSFMGRLPRWMDRLVGALRVLCGRFRVGWGGSGTGGRRKVSIRVVSASVFVGSPSWGLVVVGFVRVRERSRASAQRERWVAQVPLRCASREERTVLAIGPADLVRCPMSCRNAGKDAGSAPIIVIMGSCVQAS
jgi:hypothetical protein